MSWQELQVSLQAADLERTEALLRLAGAEAISLADGGDSALLEPPPGSTPLWPSVSVTALFPQDAVLDRVIAVLQSSLDMAPGITVRALRDEEWEKTWLERPKTRRIGRRLMLSGAGEDHPDFDGVLVKLNLGLAFGTGDHPTTALCLEWLDAELPEGARVLDYGCGSGILAIAALRLGAASAWGVDIDPQALRASGDNAALNGVEDRLWVGPPGALADIEVDVVIANILAGPLQELSKTFAECLRPGGRVVLSGILETQSAAVQEAYRAGFGPFIEQRRDGWICLSAIRL